MGCDGVWNISPVLRWNPLVVANRIFRVVFDLGGNDSFIQRDLDVNARFVVAIVSSEKPSRSHIRSVVLFVQASTDVDFFAI
jgi:hypothetical protein